MSIYQNEAFSPRGARLSKIEAIAVTPTSAIIDLSTRTNIYAELLAGRLMLADADGADIYYAFNSENAGTINEANTTAGNATQCARIPAGALVPMRPYYHTLAKKNASGGAITVEGACRYLLVKTATGGVNATLRLSICSEQPSDEG